VQYGLGPIGQELAKVAAARSGLAVVGGIDVDPELVGRDLGDVLGIDPMGVQISGDAPAVLAASHPNVVLHATGSSLELVATQIEQAIRQGAHLISTCEELSWPFVAYPALSERLDQLAKQERVSVLGAGVNPGFVMDKLAATLMGVCQEVRRVHIERVVDAGRRREPLQRKVGAGLEMVAFEELVADGRVRHVGLAESAHMIASIMGLGEVVIAEEIGPVIAEKAMRTDYLTVHRGQVAGVEQAAIVTTDGQEVARLGLRMAVGAQEFDRIVVDGVPPIDMTITGGVHGDRATAGIVVNCIPAILEARAGLRTMLDVPLRYWASGQSPSH
jgi:4-hydroxy-tetrahydrodipicolinate reductase